MSEEERWGDREIIFINLLPPASCLLPLVGRWGDGEMGRKYSALSIDLDITPLHRSM
ncbi:MAG: hypothetical protein F6K36_02505 [Symploca sp. SIO3C6]|nr:hypothetical protein [Symploca sp. SIO3C6]